jgi:hypothetical protein
VTDGDFATTPVDGTFSLAYLVFNTIHEPDTASARRDDPSVWPAELDLMARFGGMRLRERWSGWRREPFTRENASHVSVWEKTA